MACYDPKSDRILGCREGTLLWWHERRHQEQYRSGLIPELESISGYLLLACIGLLIARENSYCSGCFSPMIARMTGYALGCFLPVLAFNLYIEVDAWVFAFKNHGGVD